MQRVIHNQECMQQHNVEYGVSNSSLEFERLRTQERIAERLNSQKVPKVVEVTKQRFQSHVRAGGDTVE